MVGWHHRLNEHEFERTSGVGDGQGNLACCSPRGRKESNTTERLNCTENWGKDFTHIIWFSYVICSQLEKALGKYQLTKYMCNVLCSVTQSCLTLFDPMNCSLPGSSVHGDSPGKRTGVCCHALLQGIFPTHRLNPGLSHISGRFFTS